MSFGESVDPGGMELGSKEVRTLAGGNTLMMQLFFFFYVDRFLLFNQFSMAFHHLCQLQIGTCQGLLPATEQQCQGYFYLTLRRLNPVLLQLLTFNTPPGGIQGGEWGTLCSRETSGSGPSTARYFQELISWSQSLHLLISRKELNPFTVTSAPCDLRKPFVKQALDCTELPFTKILHADLPPLLLWSSLWELRGAVSWAAVFILPQRKLNSQLACCDCF